MATLSGKISTTGEDLLATIAAAIEDARSRITGECRVMEVSARAVKQLTDNTSRVLYEVEVSFSDESGWWAMDIR